MSDEVGRERLVCPLALDDRGGRVVRRHETLPEVLATGPRARPIDQAPERLAAGVDAARISRSRSVAASISNVEVSGRPTQPVGPVRAIEA